MSQKSYVLQITSTGYLQRQAPVFDDVKYMCCTIMDFWVDKYYITLTVKSKIFTDVNRWCIQKSETVLLCTCMNTKKVRGPCWLNGLKHVITFHSTFHSRHILLQTHVSVCSIHYLFDFWSDYLLSLLKSNWILGKSHCFL